MKVTVVIPTSNRPDFLCNALESVMSQTAFDSIESIFVSDNGGISNKDLIKEFPKVKYILREEKSTAFAHGKMLWKDIQETCTTPLVAILHDDDWWTPTHLENALKSFDLENIAYYAGAFLQIKEDERGIIEGGGSLFAQAAMKWPSLCCARWRMREKECLLASMFGTFTHYSTMVIRTEILKKCLWIYDDIEARSDNDRRLQFILSKYGDCCYNPLPLVFARLHANSDNVSKSGVMCCRYLLATTNFLVKHAKLSAEEILKELISIGQSAPQYVRPMYLNAMRESWVSPELLWLDSLQKYGIK